MPGPNRINFWGLSCSCVVQGAIMGGLFFSGWNAPPKVLDERDSRRPLVIELIPRDVDGKQHVSVSPRAVGTRPLPTASVGGAPAPHGGAIQPAVPGSVLAGSNVAVAAPADIAGAPPAASGAELNAYQRRLYDIVARNSRYPGEARRQQLSGITHLAFRLDRLGNVLESWVQESSGSELLDDAALDALKRAQPLPPIPPGLPSQMDFVIQIDSSLLQQHAPSIGN